MKKITISLALLLISVGYNAQVGVNTELPLATLDVKEKRTTGVNDTSAKDGVMIPKLTKTELASKTATAYTTAQNGTIIYVSDATGGTTGTSVAQVTNINAIGFYYLDAAVWKRLDTDTNTNLYNTDGSLSGNRTVTQVGNTLAFTGTAVNAFSVDGTTLSVDAANNRVGIGTAAPSQPLDVNANNNPLQISSLAVLPANTAITSLVIDGTGKVYKNSTQNVEGQIMRYPLAAATLTAGSETPIRITSTGTLNAPNGASNTINTIINGSINTRTNVTGSNGAPNNRNTEQIDLPAGIYKIEVRFIGTFSAASAANTVFVKAIVGNQEYSLQPFSSNSNTTGTTGFIFSDYINLPSASTLDFTALATTNNFSIVTSQSPVTGTESFRSLVLVQRLK